MASRAALDWVLMMQGAVGVGDFVSTDAGGMPIYRVVALEGASVLLEDERSAALRLMPIDRFPWKASPAEAA